MSVLEHPLVRLADRIAEVAHGTQRRKWSEDWYITHPRRVAELVAELPGMNEVDVAVALLHDVIEDTPVKADQLRQQLLDGGQPPAVVDEVVGLVLELSKSYPAEQELSRAEKREIDWVQLRTISRRAQRLKMCDRLDNLSGGLRMPTELLSVYLSESLQLAAICGPADLHLHQRLIDRIDELMQAR